MIRSSICQFACYLLKCHLCRLKEFAQNEGSVARNRTFLNWMHVISIPTPELECHLFVAVCGYLIQSFLKCVWWEQLKCTTEFLSVCFYFTAKLLITVIYINSSFDVLLCSNGRYTHKKKNTHTQTHRDLLVCASSLRRYKLCCFFCPCLETAYCICWGHSIPWWHGVHWKCSVKCN
jgi:hypothetical protein